MKLMLWIAQPFIYLAFAILLIIILLPWSLVVLPFNAKKRFVLTAPMWVLFFRIVVKFVFLARVLEIDERDEASQKKISPAGLYIANHQSFGDIPVVFSKILMPPIMKKEVLYIPILGICAYSSGAIVVDRKDKDSRKKVFEMSKQNLTTHRKQLQYYPEGTRRKDGGKGPKPYNEIKTALMHVAYEYKIPLYPISIYGTPQIINGGFIRPFQKVGIHLHPMINPEDFDNAEAFCQVSWQKVIDGYFALEAKINS